MPDDEDRPAVEVGEAADDGGVVGEAAVPVQLEEVRGQGFHVVHRVGTARMARQLHALVPRQGGEDLLAHLLRPLLEGRDFLEDVHVGVGGGLPELVDPLLQLGDRPFEIEIGATHSGVLRARSRANARAAAPTAPVRGPERRPGSR